MSPIMLVLEYFMTLGFLKQGSKINLRGKMINLTSAKLKISVMEADSLGEVLVASKVNKG